MLRLRLSPVLLPWFASARDRYLLAPSDDRGIRLLNNLWPRLIVYDFVCALLYDMYALWSHSPHNYVEHIYVIVD